MQVIFQATSCVMPSAQMAIDFFAQWNKINGSRDKTDKMAS